jgi:hypothetical protein
MTIGKPEAAAAVDRLLMMGMRMPETCWAVFKLQAVNLYLIAASSWYWLVWMYADARTYKTLKGISLFREWSCECVTFR